MLTSAAHLRRLLQGGEAVTVLDVRWRINGPPARLDFDTAHIPGAAFADLDRDLAAAPGPAGRHPLPAADPFGSAMRRLGVRSGTPVVCYDQRDGTSAARCWWLLTYYGHPSASVLDGGIDAWVAAGGQTTRETVDPPAGDFMPSPGHLPLLDADGAAAMARAGTLLDARSAERFRGEAEPIDPVAGHIPGALSAPTAANVSGDGFFLTPESLRRRFEDLGVRPGRPVGAYCGSGVTAAHEVLALRLAGIDAALYAGSWSEWIADPGRPVATGP